MPEQPGVTVFLTARTAHDLQHLCGMVQLERTRDDGRHPYPSVLNESLREIREKLSAAWRAQADAADRRARLADHYIPDRECLCTECFDARQNR